MAIILRIVLAPVSDMTTRLGERRTRKPSGELGVELKLATQSMNVWDPLIANTITFMSSIGADLTTMAFVPVFQSPPTSVSFSSPADFS
jgi:hypothetical protein